MATKRHSTVQFNPTEWLASTARMPRVVRSVYFDLCVYTWERVAAVPPSEVYLMISDLPEGQGEAIIENLVQSGQLERMPDGSVFSGEAMIEAQRAYVLWEKKSRGGRGKAAGGEDEAQGEEESAPAPKPAREAPRPAIPPAAPLPGAREIGEAWNRLARSRGLKQIAKMTAERENRLNARIADHGAEAIVTAIERLADNEMVLATKPTFDSLLNPETCAKLVTSACGETAG